jgi:hypothetical protein
MHYNALRKITKLMLKGIIEQTDKYKNRIEAMTKELAHDIKPTVFHGRKGYEVQSKKGFETTCAVLIKNGINTNPKTLTTLAFYQACEVLNNDIEAQQKQLKKAKNRKR